MGVEVQPALSSQGEVIPCGLEEADIADSLAPAPQRLTNSLLDTSRFHGAFGVVLPDWTLQLKQVITVLFQAEPL